MSERTDADTTPASAYAYCAWHKAFSSTARLVQIVEQGSGPGAGLFACASCRTLHRLTPIADQP